MKNDLGGVKDREEEEECCKVKERAEWPENKHIALNNVNIPALRLLQNAILNGVSGDTQLRQIIEKVIEQDLDWQHGEKRQHPY